MKPFCTSEIKQFWDDFSDKYQQNIESHTIPINFELYSLTQAHRAESIIETGVGAGAAAHMFSTGLMSPSSSFVSTDISEAMIDKFLHKFKTTGYNGDDISIEKFDNKSSEKLTVDFLRGVGNKGKRCIRVGTSDSEALPFEDHQFDVYIANFSLNIVDDYMKMLSEARRVSIEINQ